MIAGKGIKPPLGHRRTDGPRLNRLQQSDTHIRVHIYGWGRNVYPGIHPLNYLAAKIMLLQAFSNSRTARNFES